MAKLPKVTFETLQTLGMDLTKKMQEKDITEDMGERIEQFVQEQPVLFFYVSQLPNSFQILPAIFTMYEMLCAQVEIDELNKMKEKQTKGGDKT